MSPNDLRNVELTDLLTAIVFRVIENDRDAATATGGMIELIRRMSQGLSEKKRFALAEKLRDLADQIEQRRVAVRI